MKSIRNTDEGFPGGYCYLQPETKFFIEATHWQQLKDRVREHRKANNIPCGPHWEQDIVDFLCARHPERCTDTEPPSPAQMAANLAKAFGKWVKSGFSCVNESEYNKRKQTCLNCPEWRGEAAFGYGRCGSCGCLAIKLFMKTEKCPKKKW